MEPKEKNLKAVIKPFVFKNEKFINANSSTIAKQKPDSIIIFNENHRIPINRYVMCDRCPYFKAMSSFKEASAKELVVHSETDVIVFKALVDYVHTGKMDLSTGNLKEVINAAFYFRLDNLLGFCFDVLEQNINMQTTDWIYCLTNKVSPGKEMKKLRKGVLDFEEKHFHKIAKSQVFCAWKLDHMLELLSSEEVVVTHEKKVLKCVLDWLEFDSSKRHQHATVLFRKLRFFYLDDRDMGEVVLGGQEENARDGLVEILMEVATQLDGKFMFPRVYHKGIYMYLHRAGRTQSGGELIRYSPDDLSVTYLNTPDFSRGDIAGLKMIVNNDGDIFIVHFKNRGESNDMHMEKYDVMKKTWISKASTLIGYTSGLMAVAGSYCQDKIYVFLTGTKFGCYVYCVKTNTWHHLPAFDNKSVIASVTSGDSIYMTNEDKSINFLQYTPSNGKLIAIPFQYDISLYHYEIIAYKSNIVILPKSSEAQTKMVVYNTVTKQFRSYDCTETFRENHISLSRLSWSLYKEFVYAFNDECMNVHQLDLSSFIYEANDPMLLPRQTKFLPLLLNVVISVASIQ